MNIPRMIRLADGIGAVSPQLVSFENVNGFDVEIEVVATPANEKSSGRFVCHEIKVTQRSGGPQVTSESIRSIPVATLLRKASADLWLALDNTPGPGVSGSRRRVSPTMASRFRREGPTDEVLDWVARSYRLALIMGEPPTRAVETTFRSDEGDLPRSTAGRWVKLARQRGFLGAAEGPGKAGG